MRVWDVRKGACTTAIDAWHGASVDVSSGVLGERSPWVGCVALDSLENWLACGSGGGAITLWSLTAGVATARMRMLAPPQTLLLPGDRIVAGGSEPYVTNWSLSGAPALHLTHSSLPTPLGDFIPCRPRPSGQPLSALLR